ncbi:hypothetical protein GCM10027578_15680 [Spirosoma luteolum]
MDKTIILVDPDDDDYYLLEQVVRQTDDSLNINHFTTADAVISHLQNNTDPVFMIICEINLPGMSGVELRAQLDNDPTLRARSIPFLFMSDPVPAEITNKAYDMTVQGVFQKPSNMPDYIRLMKTIVDYWTHCLHPNR